MYSHKRFLVIIALSVLISSSAIASDSEETAMGQLFSHTGESDSSWEAGTAVASSDRAFPDCASSDCTFPDCGGCGIGGRFRRCCCPRWTAAADFIVLDRTGGKSQTLISLVDSTEELLNSNDFSFGFYGGPRISLVCHNDCCYDFELLYFGIEGWSSSRSAFDESGVIFTAPNFTALATGITMQFDWASQLYNAEFNVRWTPFCRVSLLAGFRWVELREQLEGNYIDSTTTTFWTTNTKNNLYGLQIGAEAKLWGRCRFSINGLLKAGIYGNHAEQTSSLS